MPPAMEEHQPRFLTEAEYQRLLAPYAIHIVGVPIDTL